MKQYRIILAVWALLTSSIYLYSMHHALAFQKVLTGHHYRSASNRYTSAQELVTHTTHHFKHVTGFKKLMQRLEQSMHSNTPHITKGFLYQCEVALDLLEHGHVITEFERYYENPTLGYGREFDIITDQCAIECKNIEWKFVSASPKIAKQLERQITEQYALVRAGTLPVNHYMFYSKNPVPEPWKQSLHTLGILCMQGPFQYGTDTLGELPSLL